MDRATVENETPGQGRSNYRLKTQAHQSGVLFAWTTRAVMAVGSSPVVDCHCDGVSSEWSRPTGRVAQ